MAKTQRKKSLTRVLHEKARATSFWHIFLAVLIICAYFVIGYLLGYKLRISP